MKTLVVYGSAYGFAEDCAKLLVTKLEGETVLVNACKQKAPDPEGFDSVVIGGSIYMGKVQKQVAEFCAANAGKLAGKRVALFLCGGMPEEAEKNMRSNFPAALLDAAVSKEYWGGELRREKLSMGHKMVMSMITKAAEKNGTPMPAAKPENIARTAQALAAL